MNSGADNLRDFRGRLAGEFLAYFLASLAALALDMGLLLYLARFLHYAIAASISFVAGSVVHYQICILFVFRRRKLSARKLTESAIFILAGVFGLIVNVAVISFCVELFATPLLLAKLFATGCSFLSGYLIRKAVLF